MRQSLPKTTDLAQGKWKGILMQLGLSGDHLTGRHGPCPMCGGKDRFRWDNRDGSGSAICSHCGSWSNGIFLIKDFRGWDFKTAAGEVDKVVGMVKPEAEKPVLSDADKRARMRELYLQSRPIEQGDPVDLYLTNRGVGERADMYPRSLRYVPECWYAPNTTHPAMIAIIEDQNGEAVNIHRTFLTRDGQKLPVDSPRKIMAGGVPAGSSVRLSEAHGTIGVAEGIETALGASALFSVPVWACLTATLLQNWIPPVGISNVIIFGDCDKSYTGQAAAYTLARRLQGNSTYDVGVEVRLPSVQGADWLDEYVRGAPS